MDSNDRNTQYTLFDLWFYAIIKLNRLASELFFTNKERFYVFDKHSHKLQ